MINLTELKQLLAEMTPRPWVLHGSRPYLDIGIDGDADHQGGPVLIASIETEAMDADRPGIIALVNAAPLMLEIVDALLAKEQSEAEAERSRDAWRQATRNGSILAPSHRANADDADSRVSDAIGRLSAALAKVTR